MIAGALPRLYQCHCSLCRRQSGSSANTASLVAADNFRWLAGQERIASWVRDSGFRSDFCSRCGSPVPNPLRAMPYYWVPAGLLEDGPLEIVAHLFVDSKATWEPVAAQGRRYGTAPELSDIIALLNANGHV